MSLLEEMAKKVIDVTENVTLEHVEFNGLTTYEDDYVCDVTGQTIKAGKYYGVNVTMLFPICPVE
jgi:hypothetical protein